MKLVLIGPPASGKGSQAELLVIKTHLSWRIIKKRKKKKNKKS